MLSKDSYMIISMGEEHVPAEVLEKFWEASLCWDADLERTMEIFLGADLTRTLFTEAGGKEGNQRLQVIVLEAFLEFMINELVKYKFKNGERIVEDHRAFPYSTKILLLHGMGLLDDALYGNLKLLHAIRNDAAHKQVFKIDKSRLQAFKRMALSMRSKELALLVMPEPWFPEVEEYLWYRGLKEFGLWWVSKQIMLNLWLPYGKLFRKAFQKHGKKPEQ